jgi:hypothetical protein
MSFVKNICGRDCLGKSSVDRGRKASKISALVDSYGVPLTMLFHPGNKNVDLNDLTKAQLIEKVEALLQPGACPQLQQLDLTGNGLGVAGAKALAGALCA